MMLWEYEVLESLLQAIGSLYNQSKSCVRIRGTSSNSFQIQMWFSTRKRWNALFGSEMSPCLSQRSLSILDLVHE